MYLNLDIDKDDTDNEDLINYQEELLGTDKNKADTDSDSLDDFIEAYITESDSTKFDNYDKGVSDAEADFDGDTLSNKNEQWDGLLCNNRF